MLKRICKIALVLQVAVFVLIVAYNNVVDYKSNFEFVKHVLSMDTLQEAHSLHARAITQTALHHASYWLIIATEFVIALLCLWGALHLFWQRNAAKEQFNKAKAIAVAGLTLALSLWFFGFLVVGGEWFVMWQSPSFNGQQAAFRTLASLGLVLLFLNQSDDDL